MESEGSEVPRFPVAGDNCVERIRYAPPSDGVSGRMIIYRDHYFEGVTPGALEFTIGGCRPAEKWLKDRRSRVLGDDEVAKNDKGLQ